MDPVSITIGLCDILSAALVIALCLPLRAGRIKRNRWYGMRLPRAYESEGAWLAINRYGATRMIAWSVVLAVVGLLTLPWPLAHHPVAAGVAGAASFVLIIPCVEVWRFAKRWTPGNHSV